MTAGLGGHECQLRSGPDVIDVATVTTTAINSTSSVVLTGVTASSGLARIQCDIAGGNGSARQVKPIAIPVASIG